MSDECVGYLRDVNDGENIFEVFEGKLTIGRQEANNVRNSQPPAACLSSPPTSTLATASHPVTKQPRHTHALCFLP